MHSTTSRSLIAFLPGLILATALFAQTPKVEFPSASPTCTIKQRVGLTDIEIVYSRPGMKGRAVFGGIVPYDAVWRTGANASTKISFSTPVKLDGNQIPAGTYALYTIPGKKEWTIILSKDTEASAFKYSPTNDLVRFTVTPVKLSERPIETLVIEFNQIKDESALINLAWDKTQVPIKLEVEVVSKVVAQLDAALASPEKKDAGFYYQAAAFYFHHDMDLKKALGWVDMGIADPPPFVYVLLNLKAQILAKQGDKAGAIAAAKQSSELAIKAEGAGTSFVKINQDLIAKLR